MPVRVSVLWECSITTSGRNTDTQQLLLPETEPKRLQMGKEGNSNFNVHLLHLLTFYNCVILLALNIFFNPLTPQNHGMRHLPYSVHGQRVRNSGRAQWEWLFPALGRWGLSRADPQQGWQDKQGRHPLKVTSLLCLQLKLHLLQDLLETSPRGLASSQQDRLGAFRSLTPWLEAPQRRGLWDQAEAHSL